MTTIVLLMILLHRCFRCAPASRARLAGEAAGKQACPETNGYAAVFCVIRGAAFFSRRSTIRAGFAAHILTAVS
jgi:hypothetical protein